MWIIHHARERFHEYCLDPKFQNKNSVMIWGGICGSNGGCVTPVVSCLAEARLG